MKAESLVAPPPELHEQLGATERMYRRALNYNTQLQSIAKDNFDAAQRTALAEGNTLAQLQRDRIELIKSANVAGIDIDKLRLT